MSRSLPVPGVMVPVCVLPIDIRRGGCVPPTKQGFGGPRQDPTHHGLEIYRGHVICHAGAAALVVFLHLSRTGHCWLRMRKVLRGDLHLFWLQHVQHELHARPLFACVVPQGGAWTLSNNWELPKHCICASPGLFWGSLLVEPPGSDP